MKSKANLLKLLSFSFLFLMPFISSSQVLSYNEDLTGTITSLGEVHTYTFSGTEGDVILIRMRGYSQGVDGCIELFDPAGTSIAADCDDGGIVVIKEFTLPSTGTYTLKAEDANSNDTGDYGLSLSVLNDPTFAVGINDGDDLFETLLHHAHVNEYSFKGKAGDDILIQMRSEVNNLESEVRLYAPDGTRLKKGVTSVGLTTIKNVTLPEDGTYIIIANDGNGNDIGNYGLSLEILNDYSNAVEVSCGMNFTTTIEHVAEMDAYKFSAKANDILVLHMAALNSSLEPQLVLFDPSGNEIASDVPVEGSAKIDQLVLEKDGEYLILIRDEKGNDTGDFSLSLQIVNDDSCIEMLNCSNGTFTSSLDQLSEIDMYGLELEAGDVLNIQMRGLLNGIDALIQVYDPSGNLVAEKYKNGSLSRIKNLTIPVTGKYLIAVSDRGGNDQGDYGFSFQVINAEACVINLDCDNIESSKTLNHFGELHKYAFTANAGDMVTFEMSEIDPALEPQIELYGPEGTLLEEAYASYHADITDYALPTSGTYVILALDKNGNDTGAYTLDFALNNTNGTSVCVTCDDEIQNGDETGVDCGGLNCAPCCPDASTVCVNTPDNFTITCSELSSPNAGSSDEPLPVSLTGAGSYDMTITFDQSVESQPGTCIFEGVDIWFDSGCVGIRTACYADVIKLTPDYPTCLGPLPELPFTIHFGTDLAVYFNESGEATVDNVGGSTDTPMNPVEEWLTTATPIDECGAIAITNDFNTDMISADCAPTMIGEHVVTFKATNVCGVTTTATATLTIIDDLAPVCQPAGTECLNPVQDLTVNCSDLANGNTIVADWLYSATAVPDCGEMTITSTLDANEFANGCSPNLVGERSVEFKGVDLCGNISYQKATLTIIDDVSIVCDPAGTPCDDNDANTYNDVEDGDCNCVGAAYCPSSGENSSYEFIDKVKLGSIANASGNNNGYGDFTDMGTELMRGIGHAISLTPGFSDNTYTENWKVWIDLNNNGSFEDAGELLLTAYTGETVNGEINIPATTPLDKLRMRVSMLYFEENATDDNNVFSSCTVATYGEVEDYTVKITELVCPAAGTSCDDGNPVTVNDVEDGNCNCAGEVIVSDCPVIDFNFQNIKSYTSNQDKGIAEILENGAAMMITDNAWKYISHDWVITSETVIEFDFKSTVEGEIHGIGMDNNNSYSQSQLFNLHGTSSWGINDYSYTGNGEYQHFVIPIGQYLSGNYNKITFAADHDANPKNGNSFFRNIKVYDGTCTPALTDGCGTGAVSQDSWFNISGSNLSDVPWNTTPDESGKLTDFFQSAYSIADNYGTRIRGYVCPPQSGYYTFWLSSDNAGQLYLSQTDNPSDANLIASLSTYSRRYEWDKYATQKSIQIYLEAGQSYYIATYTKENVGNDHVEIGWKFPDGTLERPMKAMHLSPFDGASTNSVGGDVQIVPTNNTAPSTNSSSVSNTNVAIALFPNPATHMVQVDVSDLKGENVQVILSNSFGQAVLTESYSNLQQEVLTFDLSGAGIGNGFYNISVLSDGVVITKPFVVSQSQH